MSQQVNLFNPVFLKQKKIFSAVAMAQGLALVTVGLVAMAAFAGWQVRRLEAEVARNAAWLKAEETRLAEVRGQLVARKPSPALVGEAEALAREVERREAVLGLVEKAGEGRPGAGVYLRALARSHREGLWLTGFELAGDEITLTGRALEAELVPDYLGRLGREEALRGRRFATLRMERPKAGQDGAVPAWIEFTLRSTPPREGS